MSKEDKKKNYTPSLEMSKEVKKRNFFPTLEISKKKVVNKFESSELKPIYNSKNQKKPQKFKPIHTSKNKAEILQLPLNYQPKTKVLLLNFITPVRKDEKFNPYQIKNKIRNFSWENVSRNWVIKYNNKKLQLDSKKDPSNDNPLYIHKDWLNTVYNNESWNLNDSQIAEICKVDQRTVCKWRKRHLIPTKPKYRKQSLYLDGKSKECGKCHEIKQITEYAQRVMRGKKTLRSICNSCKVENKQIYQFKNKFKVVQNIYNGELKGKCLKCNIGVEFLPVLEFHHLNIDLKINKRINFNLNWKKIKQQLEQEKVMILCVNCHSQDNSKIYNKYKKLIQRKSFGANATNKEIKKYVKSYVSIPNHSNRVIQLIKKKEIINQLYGGKCIGCGKITAHDNLPALHFHHRDGDNLHPGSETFNTIKNKEFSLMKKQLKKENCIAICGNCHKMQRTFHFKNNYE